MKASHPPICTKTDCSHYSHPSTLLHPPHLPLFHLLPAHFSVSPFSWLTCTSHHNHRSDWTQMRSRQCPSLWCGQTFHLVLNMPIHTSLGFYHGTVKYTQLNLVLMVPHYFFSRLTTPQMKRKWWLECRWTNQFVLSMYKLLSLTYYT